MIGFGAKVTQARRLSTSVVEIDAILGGGLSRGAIAVLIGTPAAGTTNLANQIAFMRREEE